MNTPSSPITAPSSASAPAGSPVARTNPLSSEAIAARSALPELGKLSLAEQSAAARVMVEIGGVKTYWHRGIASVPPYIQLVRDDEDLLLVWSDDDSSLHVFRRTENERRFTPLQVISKHSTIFSFLPRYAFVPGRSEHRASLAQLVALRSLLGLDPASPIPDLHIASATRIIGSIVLEPFLKRVFGADANSDAGIGVGAATLSNAAPAGGATL